MDFTFVWCLFLQLVGAGTIVRLFVHVLYLIVVHNEKVWRNERIVENVRRIERGF